jgi:hypothetical protein
VRALELFRLFPFRLLLLLEPRLRVERCAAIDRSFRRSFRALSLADPSQTARRAGTEIRL